MSDFTKAERKDVSLAQIARTISEFDLQTSGRLWIAFSGGVDSTVLLNIVAKVFDPHQLGVVHVNHELSHNANMWESHCASVASRLGLEFTCQRVSLPGRNLEVEGRRARLGVFEDLMREGDVLATAHHRDDELESLMWQLTTGRALVGIPNCRRLGHGRIWRPLLPYSRYELVWIARRNGWTWIEDESNLDVAFTRNMLRHKVIPNLRRVSPDFESQLLRLKEPPLESLPREPIEIKALRDDSTKVRSWLHAYDITPKNSVVNEIMRQATARSDAQVLVRVSSEASVRRFKHLFYVVGDAEPIRELPIRVGEDASYAFGELTWVRGNVGLPREAQLHVDSRQGGESLRIDNYYVKLSKWFYGQDVPPWERDVWPLFFHNKKLIAVPGLGVDSSVCTSGGYIPNWRRTAAYS